MKLLLTNDDGIKGEGLTVLASALQKVGHEVVVVAPDCNNSAISHKINMCYCFGGRPEAETGENDVLFFRQGYITVTPLLLDKTDYFLLERWNK